MQAEESKQSMREIIFGDEYIFFEGADGHPKYENIDEKWEEIIHWEQVESSFWNFVEL